MYFLNSKSTDPYYNIATEDYLLHHFKEDFFFLYVDQPSVICGKHQNVLAEINYPYIKEHDIAVVRRLSGGGTVYHDLGNVNFCFIMNVEDGKLVDFKKHTAPLMNVIESYGATPVLGVRNDIMLDGQKVSGNAEHIWKNRVLHHGTLLFDSDLERLDEAIKVRPELYVDKAVKSKRSRVNNIHSFLSQEVAQQMFVNRIEKIVSETYFVEPFGLTDSDHTQIQQLMESKYKTWDWNYGYSPKYQFQNEFRISEDHYRVELTVEKGVILDAKVWLNGLVNSEWSNELVGCLHFEDLLVEKSSLPFSRKDFIHFLF
jgi:lipoate---protein ligase